MTKQAIHQLFQLAKAGILEGFGERSASIEVTETVLLEKGACFVTLLKQGALRGCIGSLEAYRPLWQDVTAHATDAAFRDPRFAPLNQAELAALTVEISILTQPEPILNCDDYDCLLAALVPFKDGLILSDGVHRATFLPSVWEQLPDKRDFVRHLMAKAGISVWSSSMHCERYYVEMHKQNWLEID